ncbi:proline-rich transmembrane protein 4-like [Orbicella faveolata]|uniref:proline-rich transmembrane protein 4-like n=1 Tax=Orbicella faveolata TaxID=48498 RepID=UPI0009E45E46|nr:proline-rich transmembrane protein 4-like [Orbicella faveolata]
MAEANESGPSAINVWPEPFPEWTEAIEKWGWMWAAHIYGFGSLFALLTLYAFSSLYRFRKAIFARQKVHLRVMCFTLMAAGFGRSLVLFWDPYTSSESTSAIQNLVVLTSWGIATACMTSAFSIMLLIFLETTKTRLGPPKLRNVPVLVSITFSNIVYLTVSDLIVWFYPKAKVMIFICHVTFAIWGLAISGGCFVAGFKMWRNLRSTLQTHTSMDQCSLRDVKKLKRLFVFMSTASIFGVFIFSVSLYTTIGEFGVFSGKSYAKSWPWFAMQTTMRMMELLLSTLIFLIAVDNPRNCNQTLPSLPSRFTTVQNTFEPVEYQMEALQN